MAVLNMNLPSKSKDFGLSECQDPSALRGRGAIRTAYRPVGVAINVAHTPHQHRLSPGAHHSRKRDVLTTCTSKYIWFRSSQDSRGASQSLNSRVTFSHSFVFECP